MSGNVQPTDEELVARFRSGDESAFDELVARYQSLVVNMSYQYVRQYDDAVEAAQDVFVKVYHGLAEFRAESSFKTWLYTISRRTVLNKIRYLKSRGRDRTDSLDDENFVTVHENLQSDHDPAREAVGREKYQMILDAIAQLPEDHREVIVLREIQCLSYEETAEVIGCNLGTVKSRLARAREQLQVKLRAMGVNYGG